MWSTADFQLLQPICGPLVLLVPCLSCGQGLMSERLEEGYVSTDKFTREMWEMWSWTCGVGQWVVCRLLNGTKAARLGFCQGFCPYEMCWFGSQKHTDMGPNNSLFWRWNTPPQEVGYFKICHFETQYLVPKIMDYLWYQICQLWDPLILIMTCQLSKLIDNASRDNATW